MRREGTRAYVVAIVIDYIRDDQQRARGDDARYFLVTTGLSSCTAVMSTVDLSGEFFTLEIWRGCEDA